MTDWPHPNRMRLVPRPALLGVVWGSPSTTSATEAATRADPKNSMALANGRSLTDNTGPKLEKVLDTREEASTYAEVEPGRFAFKHRYIGRREGARRQSGSVGDRGPRPLATDLTSSAGHILDVEHGEVLFVHTGTICWVLFTKAPVL